MRLLAYFLLITGLAACARVYGQEGVTAHWTFDEESGNAIRDSSGNVFSVYP